jgi:MFS family permease
MFRSLKVFNYRLWFLGAFVSNTGGWMQRTAQDWIVLTELTDHDATALGITMALQFGPLLLMMPVTGLMADRFDRRKLLMWTQASMFVLAIGLGVLVITGTATVWWVYGFALALGVVTAIDNPARQAFVSELVDESDLSNAVALNSTSFQSARLVGPALAGVLIAWIGSGPVFILNGISFAGVLTSLFLMRTAQLRTQVKLTRAKGQIRDGLRYVRSRPDVLIVLLLVFLVGTFAFNFPIFISTMATVEFHKGSTEFGLLSSIMAAGAVAGSLLAARRERARLGVVVAASAGLGGIMILGSLAPDYFWFAISLAAVGVFSMTTMNNANAYVQTTTEPAMRGRVMALYMAIFAGGTPIGAPVVGWVANTFGPRWGLVVGAAAAIVAAGIGLTWMIRRRRLRLNLGPDTWWHLRLSYAGDGRELATQEIAIVEGTAERTSGA